MWPQQAFQGLPAGLPVLPVVADVSNSLPQLGAIAQMQAQLAAAAAAAATPGADAAAAE